MAAVDYVTLDEAKDQLELSGTGSDDLVEALITAASRALNARLDRELTPRTDGATRRYRIPQGGSVAVELRAATTVTLDPQTGGPTTLAAGEGYALGAPDPVTGTYPTLIVASDVYSDSTFLARFGYAELEVEGDFGAWATANVPEDVKRAAIVTVGSWLDRAVAEYANSVETDPRLLRPAPFSSWAIPPTAWSLLHHLERFPRAV